MKEFLIRLIYCEMLGHEVAFGYIHAINTTQQPNLVDKRVGTLPRIDCYLSHLLTPAPAQATSPPRSSCTRSTSCSCS